MYNEINNAIGDAQKRSMKTAVFFIDLNKFKELNDNLGHDAGDLLLIETASRLTASVRADDMVFRVGGDEFLILIKGVDKKADLQQIAGNILKAAAAPFILEGQEIEISLSIGIAFSPDNAQESEQLVKFSDIAMYEAKRGRESRCRFFSRSMLKRSSDL